MSGVIWLAFSLALWSSGAAQLNRPPQFLPGGDMARFAVLEDTDEGSPVYRLQAADPEGSAVHYSISGEHFSVDRVSGVVTLRRALDRETTDLLEVIISVTGELVMLVQFNITGPLLKNEVHPECDPGVMIALAQVLNLAPHSLQLRHYPFYTDANYAAVKASCHFYFGFQCNSNVPNYNYESILHVPQPFPGMPLEKIGKGEETRTRKKPVY